MGIQNLGCGEVARGDIRFHSGWCSWDCQVYQWAKLRLVKLLQARFPFQMDWEAAKCTHLQIWGTLKLRAMLPNRKKKRKTSKTILLHSPQPSPTVSFYLYNAFWFNEWPEILSPQFLHRTVICLLAILLEEFSSLNYWLKDNITQDESTPQLTHHNSSCYCC